MLTTYKVTPGNNETNNTHEKSKTVICEYAFVDRELTLEEEKKVLAELRESIMTGKLHDLYSVSTSVMCNDQCAVHRQVCGSICEHCYAETLCKLRKRDCALAYERNYNILNARLYSENAWESVLLTTKTGLYRIESFGDVETVTQARNYIRMIRTHEWIFFGVWTKNPGIWFKAFDLDGRPANMSFGVSSIMLNHAIDADKLTQHADFVFTVYDKDYIKGHDIDINCGSRDCLACKRCYQRRDQTIYVNERKK